MKRLSEYELINIEGGHEDCGGMPNPDACSASYQAGHSVGYVIGETIEDTGELMENLFGWMF